MGPNTSNGRHKKRPWRAHREPGSRTLQPDVTLGEERNIAPGPLAAVENADRVGLS